MSKKNKAENVAAAREQGAAAVGGSLSDCLESLSSSFANIAEDVVRVLQSLTVDELPTKEQIEILQSVRVACNRSSEHAYELGAAVNDGIDLPLPLPVVERIIST